MKLGFGNLVSYTGKYLSKAQGKATGGNLVFAKITGSTTLATDHADYDKDGFYIFTPGAAGLMVTKDDFNALKKEVKDLQDKVGDLVIGDVTYNTVAEYVVAYVASKITKSVRDAATATDDVVPTEKAVRTAIDSAVSNLGTVMEFKGVVAAAPTTQEVTLLSGATFTANIGDVVTVSSTDKDNGAEYVWTAEGWVEIGHVGVDEAVTSLGDATGAVALGTALSMTDNTLDVKLAATKGNVTLDITDGLKADVAATDIAYSNTSHIDDATAVTNVKEALDEIFDDELVIANSLVDLNTRLSGAEGDIADLKAGLDAVEHTTLSDGDATDFVTVTPTTVGSHTDYAVSATVVKGANGDDAGLATDAYVRETAAAAVDTALTWEVLTDADGE